MILKVGQAFLRRLGYNTIAAKGGRQAIEFVKAWGEKIDLVILDLIMPEMGGEKVFDAVKEIAPTLPVLLSSGYSLNGQADAIMQKGCEGFIQKPFDVQELSQILRRILDREKSNTEK